MKYNLTMGKITKNISGVLKIQVTPLFEQHVSTYQQAKYQIFTRSYKFIYNQYFT